MPDNRVQRRRNRAALVAALVCLVAFSTCRPFTAGAATPVPVTGTHIAVRSAAVVTADSIASAVGIQVLLDGGNAVDAAVAASFALAVTLPRAGNVGGGGFMLIRLADGEETFIDYREKAPLEAGRDMYLDDAGEVVPRLSTDGHLAAGVPGTVAGLASAHASYGKLPWKRLVEPAVRLARDGFAVRASLAESLRRKRPEFEHNAEAKRIFAARDYRPGDILAQPDLAGTLERIAGDWRDFYRGETAALIVAEMERGGGLIASRDLEAYDPVVREPFRVVYRGVSITSAPLPSSGGVILSQLFQILEHHNAAALDRRSSAYVHLLAEAEKIAYRGRAIHLGDTDFYDSPWERLTEPATVRRLAKTIRPDAVLPVETLDSMNLLEPEETTHISVVDRWGNAVANTYTLNGSYGSGVVVGGAGFFLNNEMDDFAVKPSHPNLYGLVGGQANAIEPGKRMLSSMTPTFVHDENGLYMVLGSPGGSTIPTTVLQVILNVIDHDMTLVDAVDAGRFHEQYLPDRIYVENGALGPQVVDDLLELGHRIEIRKPIGEVQAILIEGGRLRAVSDRRGDGRAAGY
jgi:gamma-glutamyltranspeptidase/glutathione hydrolase